MSDQMPQQADIEQLTQGYLEGALTGAEAERLLVLLKSNEALTPLLLEGLRTDSLIRELLSKNQWQILEPHVLQTDRRLINARHWFRFRMWQSLAATIAVLAISAAWFFSPGSEPVISGNLSKPVEVQRKGTSLMANAGFHLKPNDLLHSVGEHVSIDFLPEKTHLTIAPTSKVKFMGSRRGKRVELLEGELAAVVDHQPFAKPMVIRTPQAEARVIGTEFSLRSASNQTLLEVREGKVRLNRRGESKSIEVEGGYFAVAARGLDLLAARATGKLLRECWLNLPGGTLQSLIFSPLFPGKPTSTGFTPSFEMSTNWGRPFGTRTRGYLTPPLTGDYRFVVRGNGQMRLFLSPDEDPENKAIIAQIIFSVNRTDGDATGTASTNVSDPIPLEVGHYYYVELLHKFGNGTDEMSVLWTRPDGRSEPISSVHLAPVAKEKDP